MHLMRATGLSFAEYATLPKKLRCSRGETTVLLHHSKEDEHPDQTFRLVSKNTGTV